MRQISILSWFLIAMLCARVGASTCEAGLMASQHAVVIKNIQQLNPTLLSDAKSSADWSSLYVLLKQEEKKYAEGGLIDSDIRDVIVANQSKRYDFKDFSDVHFQQFYINALRSLYVRVAAFWTVQELTELNGGVLHPDVERIASRILESTSSPWTLKDRELLPAYAEAYFKGGEWKKLPWNGIFGFIAAWKKHSPYSFSLSEFSKFWSENAENFGLEFSLYGKLQLAFSGHEASLFCCLSDPGCVNCPHNRRWLR